MKIQLLFIVNCANKEVMILFLGKESGFVNLLNVMTNIKKVQRCKYANKINSKGNNYICSGIAVKPSRYKKDIIWCCLKGKLGETRLEFTRNEATRLAYLLIGSVLNSWRKNG